jgi:hypothetical protein
MKKLPRGCRAGNNAHAFIGGFRMWDDAAPAAQKEGIICVGGAARTNLRIKDLRAGALAMPAMSGSANK